MDLKGILSKIAPLAGTMIGGPWGALASTAIGAVFGKEDATEDEMTQMIQKATPEQLVQLKSIDANLKTRMKELNIKEKDLVYQDKDSARKMQIEVKSYMPAILAILLTIGFFGALGALFFMEIPLTNEPIVYLMVGSLGGAWLSAIQFYFGTTKGSMDKNNLLNNK